MNPVLTDYLATGWIQLVADFRDIRTDGTPFTLYLYEAEPVPVDPSCDITTQSCTYVVDRWNFDAECQPLYSLDNAVIDGTTLTAGGPGYDLPVYSSHGGTPVTATAYDIQIAGELTFGAGGEVTGLTGLFGGAFRVDDVEYLLSIVDEAELPYTKDFIQGLLDFLLVPDMDTDGDGTPDAVSVGGPIGGLGGAISDPWTCGDGACENDETNETCPDDCAAVCGDGWCAASETCADCPEDCGSCCVPDCTGKECGDDGCGGSCGTCPDFGSCGAAGQCQPCVPDCTGQECGHDGCGGICGTCPDGEVCDTGGQCIVVSTPCVDAMNCVIDCDGDSACQEACLTGADYTTLSLMICVVSQCPTGASACIVAALDGACQAKYAACIGQ